MIPILSKSASDEKRIKLANEINTLHCVAMSQRLLFAFSTLHSLTQKLIEICDTDLLVGI